MIDQTDQIDPTLIEALCSADTDEPAVFFADDLTDTEIGLILAWNWLRDNLPSLAVPHRIFGQGAPGQIVPTLIKAGWFGPHEPGPDLADGLTTFTRLFQSGDLFLPADSYATIIVPSRPGVDVGGWEDDPFDLDLRGA